MSVNVLVIGAGGREHAMLWKLAQSPRVGKLYAAPGNGGTVSIAESIPMRDPLELALFACAHDIGMTVVGPERPLAEGIVDMFNAEGLRIFGPTRLAAEIESSKIFAKSVMEATGIPTARYAVFDLHKYAHIYVRKCVLPAVIKASGLADGKGVFVVRSVEEADAALDRIMVRRAYGPAGSRIIIEEYLHGREVSIHALSDGNVVSLFPPSTDYKRIYDGDRGDNTGGMGAIAPSPFADADLLQFAERRIVIPAVGCMRRLGRPFRGMLYPGLKIGNRGPMTLEFNARFGDPETQCYMSLLASDVLDLFDSCVDGVLADTRISWLNAHSVTVVLASAGYPGVYAKDVPIFGLNEVERIPGVVIFHAGTRMTDRLRTSGGRVVGVTATADTLEDAMNAAYEAAKLIQFDGMQYRRDIGRIMS